MMNQSKRARVFSHNDEEHGDQALTLALSQRVGQIEVDIWFWEFDGKLDLYAAHIEEEIRPNRSLQGLYLSQIMAMLDQNNPGSAKEGNWVGLYKEEPEAVVSLAMDVKNRPEETWDHLVRLLEPFRQKGYLTVFDPKSEAWVSGPLRIIGTGDTPLECVRSQSPRYIFLDAKLHEIAPLPGSSVAQRLNLGPEIAPMASGYFLPRWVDWVKQGEPDKALKEMRSQARELRSLGIESRWWGAPRDKEIRRRIWELQLDAGVNWLSGDDLEEMTKLIAERG